MCVYFVGGGGEFDGIYAVYMPVMQQAVYDIKQMLAYLYVNKSIL